MLFLDILVGAAGALLLASSLYDLFMAVVVPRSVSGRYRASTRLSRHGWQLWRAFALRINDAERREDTLAIFAPVYMVTLLVYWVASEITGLGLLFWALRDGLHPVPSFGAALYFAGTSLLTIGYGDFAPETSATRFLSLVAGGTGLGTFAIVTTFLFQTFGAFQRREAFIVTISERTGAPPSAGQGARGDEAIGHPAEDFGAGTDERASGALEIEHERRGIDDAQGAVDIERIGGAGDAHALAGDELKNVAGLDVLLPLANGRLVLLASHAAGERKRQRRARIDFAELAGGWLLEALDQFVDAAAGIAIGGLGIGGGFHIGVGDHFDRFVDMIEDDQLAIEAEENVGELAVIERGMGELVAFVIADEIVPGVTD